jgi:hypothetical protein
MRSARNFALLLIALCVGCARSVLLTPNSAPHVDATGLQDAIAVATSALQGQSQSTVDRWTIISAQQILIKGCYVWQITFKPTKLLPKEPSKEIIGAGGEVFVNVDSMTKKTEIRFGE